MIYIIKTRDNEYRTTSSALRNADWTYIADQDPREIMTERDAYGPTTSTPERLTVSVSPDSGDWSGYETQALRVRDAHGQTTTIPLSVAVIWSEDGRTSIYVGGGDEADVTRGEWGENVSASDLLEAAGLSVSETDVDYTSLAEEFVAANPDARYYVDDERGFANEWTLFVRLSAERHDDDEDDDLREITTEEAVHYIADAVMSTRDYEALHGCIPHVAAVVEAE